MARLGTSDRNVELEPMIESSPSLIPVLTYTPAPIQTSSEILVGANPLQLYKLVDVEKFVQSCSIPSIITLGAIILQ